MAEAAEGVEPAAGSPADPDALESAQPPPCTAYEPLGPFNSPEDACPTLLRVCEDGAGRSCKCMRLRRLEKAAGPFEAVSVLEIRSAAAIPHAFTLAVRSAGEWFVAAHYPNSDSIEGGMESLGVEVLGAPRVDFRTFEGGGDQRAVILSLHREDYRWQKWLPDPKRTSGWKPAEMPSYEEALRVADGSSHEDAIACAVGPSSRPTCTDDRLGFETPPGASSCARKVFR